MSVQWRQDGVATLVANIVALDRGDGCKIFLECQMSKLVKGDGSGAFKLMPSFDKQARS